jgi:hypothetical protein
LLDLQPQSVGDFASVQRDAQATGFDVDGFDQRPKLARVRVIGKVGHRFAKLLRRSGLWCDYSTCLVRVSNACVVPQVERE